MICSNCKNEIPENTRFCGYCGYNHEDPEQLANEIPDNKKSKKKARVRKKHKGLFVFILSFSLFTGIIAGMCAAFYVAKHGWEAVPYSDRLDFLPFVELKEDEMEIYTVPTDDLEDNKESDLEKK